MADFAQFSLVPEVWRNVRLRNNLQMNGGTVGMESKDELEEKRLK